MSKEATKKFIETHFPTHTNHADGVALAKLNPSVRVVCGCGELLEKSDVELAAA